MLNENLLRLLYASAALVVLSHPIRFIPAKTVRYWYSLLIGLAMQIYVYQIQLFPIFVQHLIVFALIKWKGPKCGALITFESMIFLSAYHIYQYYNNYGGWVMKAEGLLMILVCKYSLLAYAIEDGSKELISLSDQQKKSRIVSQVTFFDFISYATFLPTCLFGPPFEYNDFKDFMELNEPYEGISPNNLIKKVGISLFETALFAGIYFAGETYYPISYMRQNQFYLKSIFGVLFYSVFSVILGRFKYYFAWKLSIAAIHSSGVSFNGSNFQKINTVNPYVVETSIHIRQKIGNWNISVQNWIEKCIYNRSPFDNKMVNQLYAFMISAFWHGFYSAYYISFFLWFSQVHLQGLIFKYTLNQTNWLRKAYERTGKIGHYILLILVSILFSHNASYFLILDGAACFRLLKKVYFIPQIIMFALIIIFTLLPVQKKRKQEPKEVKKLDKEGSEMEKKKQ